MKYSHDGDLGDTLAAMAVMRELGGGDLVLFPTDTRERYSPERVAVIAPLLEKQHYVQNVKYSDHPANEGINLGGWRFNYRNGMNLVDMYFNWIHKPHIDRDQPWLFCHEPKYLADVVFCRSPRYHGDFPWARAVKKYAGKSIFLGLKSEHSAFVQEFGDIPFFETENLWDVARIMQAAKLVLVNQTCNYWIAEGLKRPVCLEACGSDNNGLRNCHWDRTGSIYGTSQLMELPDIDMLDERLAYVCAERDLDRSVLGSKRLQLARLALSVNHLDGEAAELGVYQGGGAAIISSALPGKVLHLFDTFTGIPEDDAIDGGHLKGDFNTSLDDVQRFLAGYNVVFHQGFFPDSKAGLYPEIKYSFVHLDADTYQSTKAGLEYFVPKMVAGGCVVLDDYDWGQCPGVKKAIEEMGIAVTAACNQAWFYC